MTSSKYPVTYESGGDSRQVPINNFGEYINSKNISEHNSIALAFFDQSPQLLNN
jgi:hypothetical protein